MAQTDVQILITAKDMASPAFANVTKAADGARVSVSGFGEAASHTNSILSNMVGFAAATIGVEGLQEAVHATAGEMLNYYKMMQQGAIATAGTLMSVGKLNGNDIGWNDAFRMSTQLMKEMSDQAIMTGVSTQSLTETFRAALPAALQGGMKISQFLKLLAPLTAAGKLIALDDSTLIRDITDIMTGQNVSRTKLGQVLGMSGKEIQEAKAQGKLFEYLEDRLRGEVVATQKYLETWEGRVNHLKEAVARVGGTALTGAFDVIKEDIQGIAETMVLVDQNTQQVYVRPEAVATFKAIGDTVEKIDKALKEVISDFSWIGNFAGSGGGGINNVLDNLRYIIDGLLIKMATGKVLGFINTIKGGIAGIGTQTTLLGKLAAGAAGAIAQSEAATKAAQASVIDGVQKQIRMEQSLLAVKTQTYEATVGKKAARAAQSAVTGNTVGTMYVRGGGLYKSTSQQELGMGNAMTTAALSTANTYRALTVASAPMVAPLQKQAAAIGEVNRNLVVQKAQYSSLLASMLSGESTLTTASRARLIQQAAITSAAKAQNQAVTAQTVLEERMEALQIKRNALTKAGLADLTRESQAIANEINLESRALAVETARVTKKREALMAGNAASALASMPIPIVPNANLESQEAQRARLIALSNQQKTADLSAAEAAVTIGNSYKAAATAAELVGNKALEGQNLTIAGANSARYAIDKQTLSVGELGRNYGTAGVLGKISFSGMVPVIERIGTGLKGILVTLKNMAGGWLGVGIAAAFAGAEMYTAWNKNRHDERERMHEVSTGRMLSRDDNGQIVVMKEFNGNYYGWTNDQLQKEFLSGSHKYNSDYLPASLSEINQYEQAEREAHAKQVADQIKEAQKEQKLVQSYLGDGGAIDQEMDQITSRIHGNNEEEEKAKKEAAKAAKKYADAMGENANLITQANARMRDIIEGLKEKIAELSGSTFDKDLAAAKKSYADTLKNIAGTFKSLKSAPAGSAGTNQDGSSSNALYAMQFLMDRGLSEYGAAGIVGNLMTESGGNTEAISTTATNPESGAYGIAQWLSEDRVEGLHDYADSIGASVDDLDTQLGYIVEELRTSGLMDTLNQSQSVEEAAMIANDQYERPGDDGTQGQRVSNANAIEARYEANTAGIPLVPSGSVTYTPKGVETATTLAGILEERQIEEARRNLAIRQRKQESETNINALTGASGDNRFAIIEAQFQEQLAEIEDKRRDIYKSIAGDTRDPKEKARAETEAQRAVEAERLKLSVDTYNKLTALEDTQHTERMDHIAYRMQQERLTADEVQNLRAEELANYLAAKERELQSDKLTAEQRIALEKQVNEAQQALDEERRKRYGGVGDQLKELARKYSADTGTVITNAFSTITDEFSNLGQNMITEQKSVSQRLKDLWKNLANDILNMAMKVAMNNAMQALFGRLFGNFGVGGKKDGGLVTGYAEGGHVLGPGTSTSDSIPTMLSNGEYVVKASAVRSVGTRFLDALNSGYIARFAKGGLVGTGPSVTGGAPNIKVNITNNTGNQASADVGDVKFDGESYVISVVLNAYATNKNGFRSVLRGGA